MSRLFYLFTCSLLLATGWANALAQGTPAVSPAQRLKLNLVDNVSTFNINDQQNEYVNTLSISQPTDNKFTAGMLNEGDNYITFTRQGDTETEPTEFARINLNAVKTTPRSSFIDGLDFYGDGSSLPSSNTYVTNDMLAQISTNWGTSANGQGLTWQTNGCAYVHAIDGLTFTVPAGYNNATIEMMIMVGPDAAYGEFAFQVNSDGWYIGSDAETGYVSTEVFTGINSGDVISILGGNSSESQVTYSPDIAWIEVIALPSSYIPTVEVNPTISYKNGEDWENVTSIGSITTYLPNDYINLNSLGNVTDQFDVSTESINNPTSYNYNVKCDANVMWPESGASGNFYASVDFTTQAVTGDGTWEMNESDIYRIDNQNNVAAVIDYWGDILYTMPASFTGNQVTVTVTSCPGAIGARDLYVNGVQHTFTSSSTYAWIVEVAANGTIEFKAPVDRYSVGITSIVISSTNSSSLNASQIGNKTIKKKTYRDIYHQANEPKPLKKGAKQRIYNLVINDK